MIIETFCSIVAVIVMITLIVAIIQMIRNSPAWKDRHQYRGTLGPTANSQRARPEPRRPADLSNLKRIWDTGTVCNECDWRQMDMGFLCCPLCGSKNIERQVVMRRGDGEKPELRTEVEDA